MTLFIFGLIVGTVFSTEIKALMLYMYLAVVELMEGK
jgi:hypothetical protein